MENKSFVLATSFDRAFRGIGEYAVMTMQLYGALYNIRLRFDDNPILDRPTPWHRIKFIPKLFADGFDFVIWMDADAVITRFDVDIRSIIKPDKDLYMVQHEYNGRNDPVPNTGFLLIRNTAWSKKLLEAIWEKKEYINHKWWENAALMDIFGYKNLLGGVRDLKHEMLAKVEFLSTEWNYLPMYGGVAEPIVTHFAGLSRDDRLNQLPKTAMRAIQKWVKNSYPEKNGKESDSRSGGHPAGLGLGAEVCGGDVWDPAAEIAQRIGGGDCEGAQPAGYCGGDVSPAGVELEKARGL